MPRRIPEVLTIDEAQALLKQPNRYYPTGQRDHVMMKLMLNVGLRPAEVLNLQWVDVDLMTGKLVVRRGKGGRDRQLWLNAETLSLLQAWREAAPPGPYCFPTLKGKRQNDRAFREMVKRRGDKAGIEKDVHPHMLRHTCATELYRDTHDIRLVQQVLGHASVATTMVYTHLVDDHLAQALQRFGI
jgi:integrase